MRKLALSDDILLSVEKPARYIGGEVNSVMKDLAEIEIRFCGVSLMCMKLECRILEYKYCMICLIRGRIPGARECIRHGWIWIILCAERIFHCLR